MANHKANLNWIPVSRPAPVTLRGSYVTLEPLDAARHGESIWQAVRGHDHLWTWLAQGPHPSAAEMMAWEEEWQRKNQALSLAILPHAGEGAIGQTNEPNLVRPIVSAGQPEAKGWACYMRIEPTHGVIEVGNIVFSPELQRTRAATEAMYLMACHVFEDLGYRRYEWKCNARNEPSRRAAQRFGFTFEGIFRQHMVVKDRSRDTAWYAMLDHEWPARKRAYLAWLNPANFDEMGRQRNRLTSK